MHPIMTAYWACTTHFLPETTSEYGHREILGLLARNSALDEVDLFFFVFQHVFISGSCSHQTCPDEFSTIFQ